MSGRHAVRATAVACALALTAAHAATAHAAQVTLQPSPAQARTFATTDGGWSSAVDYGGLACFPAVTCPAATPSHQASGGADGAGDGFLRDGFGTLLGVVSTTTVSWTSPGFPVPAAVDMASLSVAVRPQIASLLAVGSLRLRMTVVDVADGARSATVAEVPLTAAASSFGTVGADVAPGTFVAGRTYAIRLDVALTTSLSAITSGTVDLDDVVLRLTDLDDGEDGGGTPDGGSGGSGGSGGTPGEGGGGTPGEGGGGSGGSGGTPGEGGGGTPGEGGGGTPDGGTAGGTGAESGAGPAGGTTGPSGAAGTTGPSGTAPAGGTTDPSGSGAGALPLTDPGRYGMLLTQCFGGDVVLTDVRARGGRVMVRGLSRFAPGTAVRIVDRAGRAVGRTTVSSAGAFSTAVSAPRSAAARLRSGYRAVVGRTRSPLVRLRRANAITAVSSNGQTVTIRGRVDLARLGRLKDVRVSGGPAAAACRRQSRLAVVGKVRVDRRTGVYVVRVRAPQWSGRLVLRTRAVGTKLASRSAFALSS